MNINGFMISEAVLKAMHEEYKKIRGILDRDLEFVQANFSNDDMSDEEYTKSCMNPIDFAFMSGRAAELERFLKLAM